jgi:epoxyqueuosine reductase
MIISAAVLTKNIKEFALNQGAELVGVLNPQSIDEEPGYYIGWQVQESSKTTKDYMKDAKSIIILGYHAFDDIHEVAIAYKEGIEYPIYQRMRLYARRVLRYLEKMGYKCIVYPFHLNHKKMAQIAGLGSIGKSSLALNPTYGPWIRLQSILTNAELVPDKPYEIDLCGDCTSCIDACPTRALTPYKVDPDKCLLGITEAELAKLILEDHPFNAFRDFPDKIFRKHMPRFTRNSVLMCKTCQTACPIRKNPTN